MMADDATREKAFHELMERLHSRWRLVITTPVIYLVLGWMILTFWFEPHRGGDGFLPLGSAASAVLFLLGGVVVLVLWRAVSVRRRSGLFWLMEVRDRPEDFAGRAEREQLMAFVLCDLACAPGLVLFLLDASGTALLTFCLCGLVLHLRAMPSGKLLGEAFFRPDLLEK